MSYQLFKPDRFLCEHGLSSYAPGLKGLTVEVTDPATSPGIVDNTSIPGRYFLSKTIFAFASKPGLKTEKAHPDPQYLDADFLLSWVYGCPHRCVYCQSIYLCRNYPYISAFPAIEKVENSIRDIASNWEESRPFVCDIGPYTDLLALEHLTGWLSRLVTFFAAEIAPHGMIQFRTKSANFAPLLKLDHRRATRVIIPLVPENQIRSMEPGSAILAARLNLLTRLVAEGYPVHLSFSPVLPAGDYEREFDTLFHQVSNALLHAGMPETFDISLDVLLQDIRTESESVIAELAPHVLDGMTTRRKEDRTRLAYPEDIYASAVRYFKRVLPQYLPSARILFVR